MDLLTAKQLDLMKASYLALKKVKYLDLHLGLMMELQLGLIIEAHLGLLIDQRWFVLMAHLIVPMIANLWVHCLVFQLDKMLELIWVILMVLLMVIWMACLRDKHWQYHLDLLMVKHLAWMKASQKNLILVK